MGEVYKMAYPAVKTAGEEVRARAEERRELMKARTSELYRKRILALEERLAKKEAALEGKHNPKVMAGLEAGRDRILAELTEIRRRLEVLEKGEATGTSVPAGTTDLASFSCHSEQSNNSAFAEVQAAFAKGATVLLQGGAARIGVLVEAARATLAAGRSVLMLVPEITLSKRLQAVLAEAFGDAVLVFHSASFRSRTWGSSSWRKSTTSHTSKTAPRATERATLPSCSGAYTEHMCSSPPPLPRWNPSTTASPADTHSYAHR